MTDHAESDEKPPERYRRLAMELVVARREAGGELSPEEEARRADELDRVWWTLSDRERNDYERAMERTITRLWRKGREPKRRFEPSAHRLRAPAMGAPEFGLYAFVALGYGALTFLLGWLCHP